MKTHILADAPPRGNQENAEAAGWIQIIIHGGPHSGQICHIPRDQGNLTFYEAGEPHRYYRLSHRPVFYHESIVGRAFGGRGGR